jgi:hypothetical protein
MTSCRFPQYLGAPLQVLWLESDDLCLFFTFLTLAMIFGGIFWILMIAVPWIYGRVKKQYSRGLLIHMLFMIGFAQLKGYPLFFEKEFFE